MSKQTAENYLDELLNSVNREEKHREMTSVDRDFLNELQMAKFGEDAWKYGAYRARLNMPTGNGYKAAAKAEADFLREFEKELEGEDFSDILSDFEETDIFPEDRLTDADVKAASEEGAELTEEDALASMLGESYVNTMDDEPIPADMVEEIPLDDTSLASLLEESAADNGDEEPDLSATSDVAPADAIDLSQMEEEDLINLLAGTEDLADIGALLAKNDSEQPVDSEDPFAAFAANEMAEAAEEPKKNEEVKQAPKGGFFEKLKTLLFGKEEEAQESQQAAETVSLTTDSAPGVEELSDENAQILAAFAEADKAEADEKAAAKGKKEKKKKEPKVKKAPKPKAPKKPKEKKPKVVDNTPPLPKLPVFMVCLLAVSIFVFVYFGADLVGYSTAMSSAEDLYKMGHYTEAAGELTGIQIKDEDSMFYGKVTTLAAVDSEISTYEIFIRNDRKAEALDAIICAAGRCEVNAESALTFDCDGELGILRDEIVVELEVQFGLTYDEAVEIYQLTEKDRDLYTIALNDLMKELGIIERD